MRPVLARVCILNTLVLLEGNRQDIDVAIDLIASSVLSLLGPYELFTDRDYPLLSWMRPSHQHFRLESF